MNKYQVIWLIIRLAGVYFAVVTLMTFFSLLGSIPALFTLPKIDVDNKNANVSTGTQNPAGNPPIRVQPISPTGNYNAPDATGSSDKKDETITEKFKGENVKNFAWFLILTAIYGAITWYLLRDGRLLYNVLNREKPQDSSKEKEAEVTQLNLSEKEN